jgi:hypothetical protein
MANTVIQFKRTNVPSSVPNTSDPSNTQYIVAGELAINMADGLVYTSNGSADGLIAIGAKQKTFQSTTITVSDTFQIGDITTQMLKANSTTILAGNTSVNATVSTTVIAVQNATSSSLINPKEIFVGNSTVNAQFNLVGGNADLVIESFAYDSTTSIATFGTSTPHNLVYPPKGTYVTLSNMTGPASPYNGIYEVANILSPTTFTVANVTFGGTVAINSSSVSRTSGYTKLLTTSNHGFANGSQIIVSGVGPDLKDPDFTFDGTFVVVNSIAASTRLQYTQYPIVTVAPSSMYKLAGDNFITYKTDTAHNLSINYYISTNSYPSGVSTPIRTQASVNAVAFATLIDGAYDRSAGAVAGKVGVGGSIYMLVDSADTDYKIFNKLQTVPVTLETNSGTYEDIYSRTITSAFYDPTTLTKAGVVQNIIITLSQPLFALGGGVILGGFTGSWAFLNDKQLPIAEITTSTAYGKILTNGSYTSAPTYDRYKCYSINVSGIASVGTIPNKSLLPFYNSAGVSLTVRLPKDMGGITNITKATQVGSNLPNLYLIRIDNTSAAQDVTNSTSDITWSRDGAFKYGLRTDRKMPFTSTGWNGYGQSTGAARTVTITFGVDVSSFSVDQWCLLYGNFNRYDNTVGPGFNNISGTYISIRKITAVNNTNKSITFDWTYGNLPYFGSWYVSGRGWTDNYYTSGLTWTNVVVQPFITMSSKVKMTARMDRPINTSTKINSIINSTAFTMQLNSAENTATTYGSYEAPLPVISGSFTRNTDVGAGKAITRPNGPKSPPAYITYDSTGSVSGDCHIEYSSYVEVTNSSSGVRITPTTFYSGNNSSNLFSNSSTLAISSPSNALKLGTGGFSISGSTAGKYDPSKPVLAVNSSVLSIGTGLKGITIDGSGKIKQYGSELDIGTEIANVFINEYSITINSNDQQTVINATSSVFPGNVAIGGSLYVGDSYGDVGQVLATNGVDLFWTDNGIDFAVDHTFEANLVIKGTLSPGLIDVVDNVGNEVQIDSDISYYTSNTLEQLTVSANTITLFSNDTYSNTTTIKSAIIKVGNSTVNSTINSSSFSGTSNNTLYVGSVTAANVVSNSQLSGNLANYQTTIGLSGNVATLSANAATYLNGKTEGNLNVNSATNALNANNASYLGTVAASSYVNTSGSYTLSGVITHIANVVVNGAIIAAGGSGTAGQVLTSNGSGNVYWSTVTSGGAGSLTSVATGNGLTGGPITTTGTISVLANSGIVANAFGLFVNTSYIATLAANSAAYLGTVAASNYVTATNLSDNLVNYAAASSITANAATAYTNAAMYADNKAATAYTNATSYADTKAATAYSNAIAYSGNAAQAYTNAVSYVDGKAYINATGNYTISGIHNHTANLVVNGAIIAGGTPGTAGQVLTSNASGNVYWATVGTGGIGSVTSIASGNGLSGGPITSTGELYVLANSGIISNSTGVFVNTSYIATLAANSAAYLGGVAATNYVTATNLTNNLANYSTTTATTSNAATAYSNASLYTDNRILTVNSAITSNAATSYTNAVSYVDTKIGTANSAITSNAATAYTNAVSYTDSKILTANSAITGNAATAYSNAVSYVDTKIGTANSAITANAATAYTNAVSYIDTKIGTANSAITSNAATAYTNAVSYVDTKIGTANSAITANAATAYTNAMADTLSRNGTYTGNNIFNGTNTVINSNTIHNGNSVFNGTNNFFNSMFTIGAVPAAAANSVSANTTAIRIGNSTVYSTINSTSVNAAAGSLTISSTGLALSSTINEVELRVTGKAGIDIPTFVVNSTTVSFTSIPLTANGTTGTSGQVLTSNGTTGAPYWSTVSGGGGSWAGGTMANSVLFSNTTSSVNATSGAVVITGGLGVNNNIYTAGRVGFANSSTSVVYSYYNAVTDSIDTVFG